MENKEYEDFLEPTHEGLYYTELGKLVIQYARSIAPFELQQGMDSLAMQTLARIRDILENDELSDSECYQQIDEIVSTFYFELGVSSERHKYDE